MSSLAIFNPRPDPQQQIDDLRREVQARYRDMADLREQLAEERQKNAAVEQGIAELRQVLAPLYNALQHVFGVTDGLGADSASPATKNSAAWEQWKQRLGGATARAIDALMVHGEMNQTQLRIILGCATRTVTNVVAALNQAKLIDKRDGKIRLKEL